MYMMMEFVNLKEPTRGLQLKKLAAFDLFLVLYVKPQGGYLSRRS